MYLLISVFNLSPRCHFQSMQWTSTIFFYELSSDISLASAYFCFENAHVFSRFAHGLAQHKLAILQTFAAQILRYAVMFAVILCSVFKYLVHACAHVVLGKLNHCCVINHGLNSDSKWVTGPRGVMGTVPPTPNRPQQVMIKGFLEYKSVGPTFSKSL